nr:uncharacterized protein LOC127321178 [Lolium perenne]
MTQGPAQAPQGLHVSKGASQLNVVSASDSSLGSVGAMEKDWHQADACEVISWEGRPGVAPVEMFFSGFRAFTKKQAAETEVRLARLEAADKTVSDRRTTLYNRFVAGYHKAKTERADMARDLEAAKAVAARVPKLEEDLRAARAQCAESEHAVRDAATKAQETAGELARLRQLEAAKQVGREEVADLSKRLEEVEQQRLALRKEVTSKSEELSATAKRWVSEISALDRGLAAAFPEAQAAVLPVAGRARDARRQATGEESSDCFSMDDYLATMAARVEPITMLGWELRKAAEELLDQLEYRRADVENKLPAENKTAWLARACAIADFVDKGIFIVDPTPPEDSDEESEGEETDAPEVPEADPAAGLSDAPPAGPPPAGA